MALSKAHEAAEVNYGENLFDHVKDLNRRTQAILAQAEVSGDLRTALAAIRECRGNTELLAKMLVAAEAGKNAAWGPERLAAELERRVAEARKRVAGIQEREQPADALR